MDTIYYTLNTRRVKVSGGADLLTFVPTPAPAPSQGGQVLDFDRCRRRLETRQAWKELSRTAQEISLSPEAPGEPAAPAASPRRERRETWLDLTASAAVLMTAAAATAAFLQLL